MGSDQQFALILVTIFGVILPAVLAVGIPLGKAWARKLDSGGGAAIDPAVLEELHQLRDRVGELEERLDFTERVLARHREPERLPGGGA